MSNIEYWKNLDLKNIEYTNEFGERCIEEWRCIESAPGYMVSNLGRIKSVQRIIQRDNGIKLFVNEKIRKQTIGTTGYWMVSLKVNKKGKTARVHRLMAIAFLPNPQKYPQINHKNLIRTDNTLSNLEWCNNSMNNLHSYKVGNRKGAISGKRYSEHPNAKPIIQKDMSGNVIKKWSCAQEAADKLKLSTGKISGCARGLYGNKTYKGFFWIFDESVNQIDHPLKRKIKKQGFILSINYKGCNVDILKNGYVVLNEYAKDELEVDNIIRKASRNLAYSLKKNIERIDESLRTVGKSIKVENKGSINCQNDNV